MKELWLKIKEALVSALPITAIVYIMALTPLFDFSGAELASFTVGAVLLVLGIGLFNLGADLAMTPMGTHVGSGLSRQKNLPLLIRLVWLWVDLNPWLQYIQPLCNALTTKFCTTCACKTYPLFFA